MKIPFPEWLPDQPPHDNKGLVTANNCYPAAQGYRPAKAFVGQYTAHSETFKGADSFFRADGVPIVLGGTETNIYYIDGTGWTAVLGTFTTPADNRWRFVQFGEIVVATNDDAALQKIVLNPLAGSALGGSPPAGRLLAVVKDFLVLGVVDGDTNKFAWSGINDAEYWTFGQRQSDYQIMPSGGDINGILGGEFGVILQRNRIARMDYVGGNEIFTISEVSANYGCVTPNSVVQHGQLGFFLSENGFVMWDGAAVRPIGNERIDRYFLAAYARGDWPDMSADVNVDEQVVCWSMGDRMFCYHYILNKWTTVTLAAEIIFAGASLSTDPDEQDTTFYVINSAHTLGRMVGANLSPTWQLPDLELTGPRDTQIKLVRPDTDAATDITIGISSRPRLGDAPSETGYTTIMPNGDMPVRQRGRYTRLRMSITAGTAWTYARGLEVEVAQGARR